MASASYLESFQNMIGLLQFRSYAWGHQIISFTSGAETPSYASESMKSFKNLLQMHRKMLFLSFFQRFEAQNPELCWIWKLELIHGSLIVVEFFQAC